MCVVRGGDLVRDFQVDQGAADLGHAADFVVDLRDDAVVAGCDFDDCFVTLDLDNVLEPGDFVAGFYEPLQHFNSVTPSPTYAKLKEICGIMAPCDAWNGRIMLDIRVAWRSSRRS
ncbi:Aste57867_518 [Aphanomyces stellatus]|uniref:Aste57867_518 protein n=1 Tax=Aphanomyces stellatus TaxID=120398 RepID=A0A485K2U1_9STRA|nr:hypothetical protein As57867_000517 [Aphanomyces stellatus]VFT77743.1 Aste57867_518 [Aphanomyces stellatus]